MKDPPDKVRRVFVLPLAGDLLFTTADKQGKNETPTLSSTGSWRAQSADRRSQSTEGWFGFVPKMIK